jgi:hypothetical protein
MGLETEVGMKLATAIMFLIPMIIILLVTGSFRLLPVMIVYIVASIAISIFLQMDLLIVFLLIFLLTLNKIECYPESFHAYRDILGKPMCGIHSISLFGLPLIDLGTALGGSYLLSSKLQTPFPATFISVCLFGQLVHYTFGVNTRFLNRIGIEFEENNSE